MDENANSKASGSEDEPLVPDIIDDEFYKQLVNRVPEVYVKRIICSLLI